MNRLPEGEINTYVGSAVHSLFQRKKRKTLTRRVKNLWKVDLRRNDLPLTFLVKKRTVQKVHQLFHEIRANLGLMTLVRCAMLSREV